MAKHTAEAARDAFSACVERVLNYCLVEPLGRKGILLDFTIESVNATQSQPSQSHESRQATPSGLLQDSGGLGHRQLALLLELHLQIQ